MSEVMALDYQPYCFSFVLHCLHLSLRLRLRTPSTFWGITKSLCFWTLFMDTQTNLANLLNRYFLSFQIALRTLLLKFLTPATHCRIMAFWNTVSFNFRRETLLKHFVYFLSSGGHCSVCPYSSLSHILVGGEGIRMGWSVLDIDSFFVSWHTCFRYVNALTVTLPLIIRISYPILLLLQYRLLQYRDWYFC